MSSPGPVVGVIADDPLRRMGLQTILEESGRLSTCATSLDEAIAAKDLSAVLLDSACVGNVLEVMERFRSEQPGAKVVVLGEVDGGRIEVVMAAGARGYLATSASEDEIRAAMETVLEGSVWAPRKVLAKLIEKGGVTITPRAGTRQFFEQMTRREVELLGLLKNGRTNRQIAASMGIETVTVKAHLGRMLRKAGVKNRVELTLKAMAEGPGENLSQH